MTLRHRLLAGLRLRRLPGLLAAAVGLTALALAGGGWSAALAAAALGVALLALATKPARGAALIDPLTRLPLRDGLVSALDDHYARGPAARAGTVVFAVAIDDLDGVAAAHGMRAVEEVTCRIARRIAMALRGTDVTAALGDGTFGAAFTTSGHADFEMGIQAAARLQAAARKPIQIDGVRVRVTVSVGFCLARRAARPSGDVALSAALDALAEARAAGPGSIRAYVRPRSGVASPPLADARGAARALEAGQIRAWFQPQVATSTGEITGFEALARWEHHERGILAPGAFIPALEAAGQVERLGEVMLFHALGALRSWDREGLGVPSVAVNFSMNELRNPHLPDRIRWELDRFDLDPARLGVEVLETVVADPEDETVIRTITRLARMGCRIDLDDFGTGYASLAALRRFPVSRIKIDRSFVLGIDEDRDQQDMVAAVASLAARLGLETVAEGVERVAEHAALARLGIGHIQGHAVGRPMPLDDTGGWLARHAERLASPLGLRPAG
jgi:diguanylate cyclase